MKLQVTECVWLHGSDVCRIEHLADASGLTIGEIEDLIEIGVIVPVDPATQPTAYRLHYVLTVQTARRLRDDFQLNRDGLALALTLLQRIDDLEESLKSARP